MIQWLSFTASSRRIFRFKWWWQCRPRYLRYTVGKLNA